MGIDLLGPDDERPPELKPGTPVSDDVALHASGAKCRLCAFDVPADEVVLSHGGQCICLRCYERETGSAKPIPQKLRESIQAILANVEG